jgi:hypothetical protein
MAIFNSYVKLPEGSPPKAGLRPSNNCLKSKSFSCLGPQKDAIQVGWSWKAAQLYSLVVGSSNNIYFPIENVIRHQVWLLHCLPSPPRKLEFLVLQTTQSLQSLQPQPLEILEDFPPSAWLFCQRLWRYPIHTWGAVPLIVKSVT